jgi:hypothetical protein
MTLKFTVVHMFTKTCVFCERLQERALWGARGYAVELDSLMLYIFAESMRAPEINCKNQAKSISFSHKTAISQQR